MQYYFSFYSQEMPSKNFKGCHQNKSFSFILNDFQKKPLAPLVSQFLKYFRRIANRESTERMFYFWTHFIFNIAATYIAPHFVGWGLL